MCVCVRNKGAEKQNNNHWNKTQAIEKVAPEIIESRMNSPLVIVQHIFDKGAWHSRNSATSVNEHPRNHKTNAQLLTVT